jgi:hypothetical protein
MSECDPEYSRFLLDLQHEVAGVQLVAGVGKGFEQGPNVHTWRKVVFVLGCHQVQTCHNA